jgi:hypothetical protein
MLNPVHLLMIVYNAYLQQYIQGYAHANVKDMCSNVNLCI